MRKAGAVLVAVLMVLAADAASAQTATATGQASIEIPTVIAIELSDAEVAFRAAVSGDYDNDGVGSIASTDETTITTRSNIDHRITIHANTEEMAGPGAKPSSDLQWRVEGGSFLGLTTTPADVVTNLSRGVHASAATVQYQMLLNLENDLPGTHSLGFTFTALAP